MCCVHFVCMCIKCRHMQQQQCSLYSFFLGLARTIYIRCIYGTFGWEITEYTVIYGVYIRLWPTLLCSYQDTAKYGLCHRPFFLYTHKCRIKDLSMAFAFFRSYFHLCTEMLQGCHLCCLLTFPVQRCCRGTTYVTCLLLPVQRCCRGITYMSPPYSSCAEMLQGCHLCCLLTPHVERCCRGATCVASLLLMCRDAAGVSPVLPPYSSCAEMLQGYHLYVTCLLLLCSDAAGVPPVLPKYSSLCLHALAMRRLQQTYTQTRIETYKHACTHTNRHTHRHIHAQTHTHTHTGGGGASSCCCRGS